jgi:hypothetical protein
MRLYGRNDGSASFRIDLVNLCLWRRSAAGSDERLDLTKILRYLAENADRWVTHNGLLAGVWRDVHVQPEVLKNYIRGDPERARRQEREPPLHRKAARSDWRSPGRCHKPSRPPIDGTSWRMRAALSWTQCANPCGRSAARLVPRRSTPTCSPPPIGSNMRAVCGRNRFGDPRAAKGVATKEIVRRTGH